MSTISTISSNTIPAVAATTGNTIPAAAAAAAAAAATTTDKRVPMVVLTENPREKKRKTTGVGRKKGARNWSEFDTNVWTNNYLQGMICGNLLQQN